MSKEKEPNRLLAALSIYWAKQKKLGNPVKNAVSLRRTRRFTRINTVLFLLYVIISIVYKLQMFVPTTVANEVKPSLWFWILLVLLISLVFSISKTHVEKSEQSDAKEFIKAITVLEKVANEPLDKWVYGKVILESDSTNYLNQLASDLDIAERKEKDTREMTPWRKLGYRETAARERKVFYHHLDLLTNLLPLSRDKKDYFRNKVMPVDNITKN